MVLHNSKWDRKATRKYQVKHGIKPNHARPVLEASDTDSSDSERRTGETTGQSQPKEDKSGCTESPKVGETSETGEGDSEEISEDDGTGGYTSRWRRKKLGSNAWRFNDLIPALEDEQDLSEIDHKTVKQFTLEAKAPKSFNKIRTSDLTGFVLGESNPQMNNESLSGKPSNHIRQLTEKEKTDFLEMQERSERLRIHHNIQDKFGGRIRDNQKGTTKTLDIGNADHSASIETKLLMSRNNTSTNLQSLTSDLELLLGSKISLQDEATPTQSFIIPVTSGSHRNSVQPVIREAVLEPSNTQRRREAPSDDFLDDILG
ncbi:hypothetical protein BABINDRAFT_162926 [Babjeviella inositovora NRRL Y-12698]|uniref:Uncharacterized protein n=1 Tax=Babjeviella inositovora NRRL Y-12698 TaxID=984486 RepID=A0A1E3QKQ8_9ASCO|nr:uncharacterized protein BABINDRAFT_162926 [Babjeviella inositovora NRRL Y-12698]ODQ78271.1 hypothetical protein BABINDRAFT_162926 [Babjeviella inositovora NRRL Y-12698]